MGRINRRVLTVVIIIIQILMLVGCGAAEFRDTLKQLVEYSSWEDQEILFVRGTIDGDKSVNEIYIMDVYGNNQRKLTQNSVEDKDPGWSADRTMIVYATLYGSDFDLAVMTPEGSFSTYLTDDGGDGHDFQPSWSPDGSQVAYTHYLFPDNQVYIKDANLAASATNLSDLLIPKGENDAFPDWSPDGTKIVFMSQRTGDFDIYIMDTITGSDLLTLTANGSDDRNPSWSPDGERILYHSNEDGDYEIYVVNADGTGNKQNLTNNTVYSEKSPDWSPDGKKILFQSDRDENWEIYMMNPDGSEQIRLTYNDADDLSPCW